MRKIILAILAVFMVASVAAAQTTMTLSGQIRVYPEMNNYGFGSIATSADSKTRSFVDQRARLFFNLKSGENVGGTVAFELDSRWGDRAYNNGRNTGGGLEADTVNAETKQASLWFKAGDMKVTTGIMGYTDDFSGIILGGADIAGFRADYNLSKDSSLSAALFTFWDQDVQKSDAVYFIPITFKQKMGDNNLGLSFYTIKDQSGYQTIGDATYGKRPLTGTVSTTTQTAVYNTNVPAAQIPANIIGYYPTTTTSTVAKYDTANIYYLGANFGGKAGAIDYNVFGLYNFGTLKGVGTAPSATNPDADISAYAFNARLGMKLGEGKVKASLLYTSGDKSTKDYNGVVTGNQYSTGADLPLMQNDLYIILRTLDDITHSTAFFTDLNNGGLGATVAYVTFDQNLSANLNAQVALGYGQYTESTTAGLTPSCTEVNAQLAYKLDKALTIKAAAAYGMLSDVKVGSADADNLYRLLVKFQYAF